MRQKKPALVITFDATAHAMAAEKYCMEHQLPGRLIPVPREISTGCGLAWKAPPEDEKRLAEGLKAAGLSWAAMSVIEI
jgi:hypothetical protein